MEFRCRLASPAARSSRASTSPTARRGCATSSRRRACTSFRCSRRAAIGGLSLQLPQPQRIPSREFLVFNQELATLLKAGMPLVQSLESCCKRRRRIPVFSAVLDDVHERVRAGTALSDAFAAHGDLFPRVYTASLLAGERSGNLDAVLRRYVDVHEGHRHACKRKTISALDLSGDPRSRWRSSLVVDHRAEGRAGVLGLLRSFDAELPLVTRIIVGVSTFVRGAVPADRSSVAVGASSAFVTLAAAARAAGALRSRCCSRLPVLGDDRARSSRRRRWRARWRRCSAAASRS